MGRVLLIFLAFCALTLQAQNNQRFDNVIIRDTLVVTGKFTLRSNVTFSALTPNRVLMLDAAGNATNSVVTPTELSQLSGIAAPAVSRSELSGSNYTTQAGIVASNFVPRLELAGSNYVNRTELNGSNYTTQAGIVASNFVPRLELAGSNYVNRTELNGSNYLRSITSANSIQTSLLQSSNPPIVKTISGSGDATVTDQGGTNININVTAGAASQTPWAQDINAAGFQVTNVSNIQLNKSFQRGITNLSGVAPKLVLNGPGVVFWTPTNETILDIVPLNSTNAAYALVSITQTGAVHNQTISNTLAFRNLPLVMLPDGENLFLVWWDPSAQTNKIFSYQTLTNTYTGTGSEVRSNAPTINTPTLLIPVIASFASATHTHQNAAGGGTLDAAAIAAGTLATARLGSGTADDNAVLRGDSTWSRSTTDGQVFRQSGGAASWGAVDLADGDAITGTLPAANLPEINGSTATIKFTDYKDFVYPGKVDGTGATIVTNDYTSNVWGLTTHAGIGGTNVNYAIYRIGTVPLDLDTAVTMTLKNLAIRVSGTDANQANFSVAFFSPASSSGHMPSDYNAMSTHITFNVTPSSPAANDIFYCSDVTLIGWASGLTAGRPFLIGIARDGGDSNNDSITIVGGTVEYGRTK